MIALDTKVGPARWSAPSDPFELLDVSSEFIAELFTSRRLMDRQGNTVPMEVFVPAAQGNLLYSLVRYLQPRASLEIGLANGVSALHLAKALEDNGAGHHLAIDPFQSCDWNDVGMLNLQRSGWGHRVTLDPRFSHWVLPELEAAGRRFQFAFVDGSHLFDYVMADFLGIDRILDVGGMIAFDDSDWPAVTRVIRFAIANRSYRVVNTGTVIEPSPGKPRAGVRAVRRLLRKTPSLHRVFRPEFLVPSRELGIDGRCVVLQKQCEDERDNQVRQLVDF